jgi:hypothetical protein
VAVVAEVVGELALEGGVARRLVGVSVQVVADQ